MTLLLLTLLAIGPSYHCPVDDSSCWMSAALTEQERAESAEGRVKLLEEARAIGDRLLADADARGERWQKLAEKVAPKEPLFFEKPVFWLGIGFVVGAVTTIAISYGVNPQPR